LKINVHIFLTFIGHAEYCKNSRSSPQGTCMCELVLVGRYLGKLPIDWI
jgi:hypothetical protein